MRKLFVFILLSVLATVSVRGTQPKDYDKLSTLHPLRCDGIDREYWLYIPEDMPENAPLVICIRGYSRKGPREVPGASGLMAIADREKFAVCVPRPCGNMKIGYGMNVGYCFQQTDSTMKKVDDVKYLTKLVRHLQKEYKLSRDNVFCTGSSNGGEMCYQMAYLKPGLFRAYAPQYGLTMTWLYKNTPLPKAVPLIELHGTADHTSEWGGDPTNEGGWGEYISVPLAVGQFALKAHCTHMTTEELPTVDPDSSKKVFLHKYVGGDNGVEVWLYEIVGAGHGKFQDAIDIDKCVWEFFSKYLVK